MQHTTLAQLFQNEPTTTYSSRSCIVLPDTTCSEVYYLVSGWACAYSESDSGEMRITHTYYPGDLFPLSWLHSGVSDEGIMILHTSSLKQMNQQTFIKHFADNAAVARATALCLARFHAYAITEHNFLDYESALQRIQFRIRTLAHTFGKPHEQGTIIPFTLSTTYLARSTQMTRETASRQVSKLVSTGYLSRVHNGIIVRERLK